MNTGQGLLGSVLNSAFGPTLNEGLHVDANGNFTDAQGNPTTPYKSPSFISRVLSPASQRAYEANQQAQLEPSRIQQEATSENAAGLNVGRSNYGLLDPSEQKAWGNAGRYALGNKGNTENPTQSLTQGTALGDIDRGIIPTNVGSDIASSELNLANTKAALNRQPVVGATQDQAAVNSLNQATQNDPLRLNLEYQQLGGAVGREPTVEELQNNEVAGQLARQPYTLGEQMGQAKVGDATASEMAREIPNTVTQMGNESVFNTQDSSWRPYMSPFGRHVTNDSVTNQRNPMGVYINKETGLPMSSDVVNAFTGGMGGKGDTVTLPSGAKGIATPMYTAPTGATDEAKQRAMTGGTGNGGVGPPPLNPGTPPPTAGGASAKTDDYATLIQNAVQAKHQYGRNSPQYADALAKIHSVEDEQMPNNFGDISGPSGAMDIRNKEAFNPALYATGLGASIPFAARHLGKSLGNGLNDLRWWKKKIGDNVITPFKQGLTQ